MSYRRDSDDVIKIFNDFERFFARVPSCQVWWCLGGKSRRKKGRGNSALSPAYIIPKQPSLNRVKLQRRHLPRFVHSEIVYDLLIETHFAFDNPLIQFFKTFLRFQVSPDKHDLTLSQKYHKLCLSSIFK